MNTIKTPTFSERKEEGLQTLSELRKEAEKLIARIDVANEAIEKTNNEEELQTACEEYGYFDEGFEHIEVF